MLARLHIGNAVGEKIEGKRENEREGIGGRIGNNEALSLLLVISAIRYNSLSKRARDYFLDEAEPTDERVTNPALRAAAPVETAGPSGPRVLVCK